MAWGREIEERRARAAQLGPGPVIDAEVVEEVRREA
jgi:hypothetical protein